MRVCVVAEGCYPYVVGGVSGWINSLTKSFPNVEFILLTIVSDRSLRGKFAYELPENVTEVHEVYLTDCDWYSSKTDGHRLHLNKKEFDALRSLVLDKNVDWRTLFKLFKKKKFSIDDLLMGSDFYKATLEAYNAQYSQIVFSDFLWTMRSIYLPLFLVMQTDLPKADVYHCVATGYSGILGSMAKELLECKLVVSEHGIYTREREEELIKATWVEGIYKNVWINQFKKMSKLAYEKADLVTSLYGHARKLQIELGCPEEKTMITPNGIDVHRLADISGKLAEDENMINIGAVLRVTPIKDVKTMIQAFNFAKKRQSNLKLWIMGPCDEDEEYANECYDLVAALNVQDVVFTGRVDIKEYLGRMDMTILTSISEGQPLTILESYAAHKPVIATDVGNCRELIYGEEGDDFGPAGILTHIMNVEEIANAMVDLAKKTAMRESMGEAGYKRVMAGYKLEDMKKTYEQIYMRFSDELGLYWGEEKFTIDSSKTRKGE